MKFIFCHAHATGNDPIRDDLVSLGAVCEVEATPHIFHRYIYPRVAVSRRQVQVHGLSASRGRLFFCGELLNEQVVDVETALLDFLDYVDKMRRHKREIVALVTYDDFAGFVNTLASALIRLGIADRVSDKYLHSIVVKDLRSLGRSYLPQLRDHSLAKLFAFFFYRNQDYLASAVQVAGDALEVAKALSNFKDKHWEDLLINASEVDLLSVIRKLEKTKLPFV